jgi:protein quaking
VVVSDGICLVQEEQNRGKQNWEHLSEDLHVLITVEDTQNRAEVKLRRAVDEVKKLLVPAVSIKI